MSHAKVKIIFWDKIPFLPLVFLRDPGPYNLKDPSKKPLARKIVGQPKKQVNEEKAFPHLIWGKFDLLATLTERITRHEQKLKLPRTNENADAVGLVSASNESSSRPKEVSLKGIFLPLWVQNI